jgi:hypothetical protein
VALHGVVAHGQSASSNSKYTGGRGEKLCRLDQLGFYGRVKRNAELKMEKRI